jgi:hypothetical protein
VDSNSDVGSSARVEGRTFTPMKNKITNNFFENASSVNSNDLSVVYGTGSNNQSGT